MPEMARNYQYQQYSQHQRQTYGQRPYPQVVTPVRPVAQPVRKKVVRKRKVNPIARIISLSLLALIGYYVLPFGFQRISKPLISMSGKSYKEIQFNNYQILNTKRDKLSYTHQILKPTTNYLSNDSFMNLRMLSPAKIKKPDMTTLYMTDKMQVVDTKLKRLMAEYKSIEPSVFVWEYDSGKFVDINATKTFPAASIIKIPVLIRLFKSIEANQLTIYDEMAMTDYFKAEGSGNLQSWGIGKKYTIDQLARYMITESDNSATNMIMSKIGSMQDVNQGIRSWGINSTHVQTWLPDMDGTNYTTAKDLATMLYNLDNPGFLNINSREYIIDYMSHVENNRLIQAGLDPKALFVHKTGDIGRTLGDAGIVFAPNGKKYICVILANRPYNSPLGKDFIQKASSIIYNSITSGVY